MRLRTLTLQPHRSQLSLHKKKIKYKRKAHTQTHLKYTSSNHTNYMHNKEQKKA